MNSHHVLSFLGPFFVLGIVKFYLFWFYAHLNTLCGRSGISEFEMRAQKSQKTVFFFFFFPHFPWRFRTLFATASLAARLRCKALMV